MYEPDDYDTHCPTCDAPEPTHTASCAVPNRVEHCWWPNIDGGGDWWPHDFYDGVCVNCFMRESHDSGSESPHSAANGSADAADSAR